MPTLQEYWMFMKFKKFAIYKEYFIRWLKFVNPKVMMSEEANSKRQRSTLKKISIKYEAIQQ